MPVVSATVRAGDPTVQVSGQHRGTIESLFDDGRTFTESARAADLAGWDARVAAAPDKAQESMERQDAGSYVDPDEDVGGSGEATDTQRDAEHFGFDRGSVSDCGHYTNTDIDEDKPQGLVWYGR